MKKILIIALVLIATVGHSQTQNMLFYRTAGELSTVYWAAHLQQAYVDGTSSAGDGGQGFYNWDNTSTATPDAFSIIQVVYDAVTVTDGRWIRRPMLGAGEITNVGTITTGVWSGTAIAPAKGGTGLTALGTALQQLRVNSGATALEYFTPSGGGSGDLLNGGNSTGATLVVGTNDANALSLETNNVVRATVTGGASTGGAWTATDVTANTNTVEVMNTNIVNSSGTAATGLGIRNLYQLETTTTNSQDATALDIVSTDATHATRSFDWKFSNVRSAAALAETFRIASTGALTATTKLVSGNTIGDALTFNMSKTSGFPSQSFGGNIKMISLDDLGGGPYTIGAIKSKWETMDASGGDGDGSVAIFSSNNLAEMEIAKFSFGSSTAQITIGAGSTGYKNAGIQTAVAYTIGSSSNALTLGNSSGDVSITTSGLSSVLSSNSAANGVTIDNTNTSTGSVSIGNTAYTSTTLAKKTVQFKDTYTAASGSGTHTAIALNNTFNMTSTASGTSIGLNILPTFTALTGTGYQGIKYNPSFTASSGSAATTAFDYSPTFNLTSTQSGNQTAININPTLTSLVGTGSFIGFNMATSNSKAIGINQTGTATVNYLVGKTSFGATTSPTAQAMFAAGTTSASTAPIKFVSGVANQTSLEAGALNYDGTNLYLSSGTTNFTLAKVLTGSNTLDFGNTVRLNSTDLSITVTGASVGDPVSLGIDNASITADGIFTAWVSATNTVTVRFTNAGLTLDRDPASGTFKVAVTKY